MARPDGKGDQSRHRSCLARWHDRQLTKQEKRCKRQATSERSLADRECEQRLKKRSCSSSSSNDEKTRHRCEIQKRERLNETRNEPMNKEGKPRLRSRMPVTRRLPSSMAESTRSDKREHSSGAKKITKFY